MQEQIRYAWGASSLGEFIAAVSDVGLLAFEFGDNRAAMLHALENRLPATSVVNDQDGLASILARLERLVEHPEQDVAIALDMRGSDYQKQVWTMLREIPAGETTSYGALAAKLGTRDARDVTEAMYVYGSDKSELEFVDKHISTDRPKCFFERLREYRKQKYAPPPH